MFLTSRHIRFVLGSIAGLLVLTTAMAPATAHHQDESASAVDSDPVGTDAQVIAEDENISIEQARETITRQPRLGLLAAALEEKGPPSFGGIFLDYAGKYEITLLATPGGRGAVAKAVNELGFSDLSPYVTVVETRFTEGALLRAMQAVGRIAGPRATSTDVDLRSGNVLIGASNEADAQAIRNEVKESGAGDEAREVVVAVSQGLQEEHSLGGIWIRACTTGFSVRRTTDNTEGFVTAAHCEPPQQFFNHHEGHVPNRVAVKDGDNVHAAWFTTPGRDDANSAFVSHNGLERAITSRTDRGAMVIGSPICHYGQGTGFGCGNIASKVHDPDGVAGTKYNAVFIRVNNVTTGGGDSGGPWLSGSSAYGVHFGTDNMTGNPVFTAQSFLDTAFNIVVKVSP